MNVQNIVRVSLDNLKLQSAKRTDLYSQCLIQIQCLIPLSTVPASGIYILSKLDNFFSKMVHLMGLMLFFITLRDLESFAFKLQW